MKKAVKETLLDHQFIQDIRELIIAARNASLRIINMLQVLTCAEIGYRIVEKEQHGEKRAAYGKQMILELAQKLTLEFGKGFSERNLRNMRRFYLSYGERYLMFRQKISAKSENIEPYSMVSIWQKPSAKFVSPFKLGWSHYIFLCSLEDKKERAFYEIESTENTWTLAELKRNFNTGLYERLALSRDKKGIQALSLHGQKVENPEDLVKDPYILEFLGIDEKFHYSETDLETAVINKIEQFLLELGKGFLFEARQKRFTFDEEHYFVDLVFYNRLLRCYVLIDLKIGKLAHQDLGQMQMYVNYFDRFVKTESENPTIGIVLCKKKSDAIVEITLPQKSNIRASEYKLYLPSKAVLKKKLQGWIEQQGEAE
jgi:predicted nuclease of restriction endonuclease-like (RecB) superfamily